MKNVYFFLIALLLFLNSCENDISIPNNNCNKGHLPVLMLHGYLAASDTYNNFHQLFTSNGYCADDIFVMDRNTLNLNGNFIPALDSVVNDILSSTQQKQINLMGHSAGGGLGYAYLNDSLSKGKVAHYAHLASFSQSEPAGEIPTLNIWSKADLIVPGGDIDGAQNVQLENADHYQVATSTASFKTIFEFFNQQTAPQFTTIQPQANINIAGKVLTLGENVPLENAIVEIYTVNKNTGERVNTAPEHSLTTGKDGKWETITVKPNQNYEFFVSNPANEGDRPLHYYRAPFVRSTPLVYLRTIPPMERIAGVLLGDLPADNEQAVTIIFSASQAIISGRDALTINGINLAIPTFTAAKQSTIALFLYDEGDQQSSFALHNNILANTPFLNAVDLFINPAVQATSMLIFNDTVLNVPNWKSASGGISVVVFE